MTTLKRHLRRLGEMITTALQAIGAAFAWCIEAALDGLDDW